MMEPWRERAAEPGGFAVERFGRCLQEPEMPRWVAIPQVVVGYDAKALLQEHGERGEVWIHRLSKET